MVMWLAGNGTKEEKEEEEEEEKEEKEDARGIRTADAWFHRVVPPDSRCVGASLDYR